MNHPSDVKITGGLRALSTLIPGLVGALCLLGVQACGAPTSSVKGQSLPGAALDPGHIVVDFQDGTSLAEIDALEGAWGIDLGFNSILGPEDGIAIANLDPGRDRAALLAQIRKRPEVESAEPLYSYHALFVPNDPDFKLQWHMKTVHAEQAWDVTKGKGVVVAVIDTGIAYRKFKGGFEVVEDLDGASFVDGYDFIHDRKEALDDHGHGTHVAGTIAQVTNNGRGVAGLAFEASLMPIKVLSAAGSGSTADIAEAIRWAADHGAQVINMSLGGGGYSQMMASAVRYARDHGVVVVAAAGNAGTGKVSYPAAYPGVIGVSATRFDDKLAPYSSWGKEVDLAAPGGDKTVDQNGDGQPDGVLQNTIAEGDPGHSRYEWFQGTSMATPHVAAAAALVMSTGVTQPGEVERTLFESARKVHGRSGRDEKYGFGVLDAGAAVTGAKQRTGIWRFVWMALLALVVLLRRGKLPLPGGGRAAFLGAAFVTGVGFFFLPLIFGASVSGPLSRPLMDYGLMAFGASAHANPLTWSALVPLLLALGFYQRESLRPVLAGVALGSAAFLLQGLVSGQADVILIPGLALDKVWLGANAALAFLLSWAMMRPRPSDLQQSRVQ